MADGLESSGNRREKAAIQQSGVPKPLQGLVVLEQFTAQHWFERPVADGHRDEAPVRQPHQDVPEPTRWQLGLAGVKEAWGGGGQKTWGVAGQLEVIPGLEKKAGLGAGFREGGGASG